MKFGLKSALYDTAREHHMAGRLQDAEYGYTQILAMDPAHFESLHMMGMLAGQLGHHAIALDFTDKAIAVNPGVAEAYTNRAMALASLGRDEEAAASFRKALDLNPDYAVARDGLVILKARADEQDGAKAPVVKLPGAKPA